MQPRDLVIRFLDSIGKPNEAEAYLALFQSERRQSFALIAVADAVMRGAVDALVVDLKFLSRLGLTPVIVFGVVRPERAEAHAQTIYERLADQVPCRVVPADGAGDVASAGDIALVPMTQLAPTIHARFDVVAELATSLGSRKLIFLGRRSGLQPLNRQVPSLVNITTEYDGLIHSLPGKQAALLAQIRRIMQRVGHPMTVAVTSPLDLLRELFTVRGAGTLVRRGASVRSCADYAGVDIDRLRALIETAFGRQLEPAFFDRPIHRLYIADDYRGAAITTDTALGSFYLSKFAVDQRARGEGIGRDLWTAMADDHPQLFWRSRPSNPITPWYTQNCDGLIRDPTWHIFWRGLGTPELAAAIEYARAQPVDFMG